MVILPLVAREGSWRSAEVEPRAVRPKILLIPNGPGCYGPGLVGLSAGSGLAVALSAPRQWQHRPAEAGPGAGILVSGRPAAPSLCSRRRDWPCPQHGFSVYWPGCPAVARTATASRTPTTAVAVSGIVYGPWKPDMAACGADAAPIANAAQPAERRLAWHPRAVRTLRTAAASPAAASPAVGAGCRAAARKRPHRV